MADSGVSDHIGWQQEDDTLFTRLKRLPCRIVEILKLQRLLWAGVIVAALFGLLVAFSVFIVSGFENSESDFMRGAADFLRHLVLFDPATADLISNVCLTILGFALPFMFVVCHQRRAVVSALASGYWNNYLSHLLNSNYRIVLIQPGFINNETAGLHLTEFKKYLEESQNIELRDETVEGARRSALVVYRSMADGTSLRLPVAIDLCRNLSILGDIVQKEINAPFGGLVCKEEYKFEFLSEIYFRYLRSYWEKNRFFNNRFKSKVSIFTLYQRSNYEHAFADLINAAQQETLSKAAGKSQ